MTAGQYLAYDAVMNGYLKIRGRCPKTVLPAGPPYGRDAEVRPEQSGDKIKDGYDLRMRMAERFV